MRRPANPCDRNCPDRNGSCHATCIKYAIYVQQCDEFNKLVRRAKDRSNCQTVKSKRRRECIDFINRYK